MKTKSMILSIVFIFCAVSILSAQSNLILWNKLGSATEVQNSEVGPNFTIMGLPDYQTGNFGNGIRMDQMGEKLTINNLSSEFNMTKGCIEMWVNPSSYSIPPNVFVHAVSPSLLVFNSHISESLNCPAPKLYVVPAIINPPS